MFRLFKSIALYLFIEISILLLIPIAFLLYPIFYLFKDNETGRKMFWIFFNDGEDGDYGDPRWRKFQNKPVTRLDWFVLSYRWNVRRNPVWNYTGQVWDTTGEPFNSPKTIFNTNPKITARWHTDYHKGHYGHGLFTFKVGDKDRFAFVNMFKVGSSTILFTVGFNEFRPVFKFSVRKTKNLKKGF